MNRRLIVSVIGKVLCIEAVLLLLPTLAALCFGESVLPFLLTAVGTGILGGGLMLIKPKTGELYPREGFVCVSLSWVVMSLTGAVPFVLSGDIPSYVDAFFETVSGFTTTGATILNDVEGMSRGAMFWRLFTHWIGGMGVLVFLMAVLPMSGEHSMHIMRAESTGPSVGKLVPRVRQTSAILYGIYFGLTVIEFILLLCGGMSFYEALLHAFATAGTGGFSTRGLSVGAFGSLYIEIVITVFMLLFSVNFNVWFLILTGKLRSALRSEEFWWFWGIVAFSMLTIGWNIAPLTGGFASGLRYSSFQVASIISTSGFATADFNLWPEYSKWLLVMIMFIGACAGSTGGGIKVSRIIIMCRAARGELRKLIRPRQVVRVQLDGKSVSDSTVRSTLVFFILYFVLLCVTVLLISFDGFDPTTNFTATIACLSNIGPGLNVVGPMGNFAGFSALSKIILSFCMLTGRLEIYPMLLLFSPLVWKRK